MLKNDKVSFIKLLPVLRPRKCAFIELFVFIQIHVLFSAEPDADMSELEAFDKVFCHNRDGPLLVGSVMSNIGYGEAASGISAITKVRKRNMTIRPIFSLSVATSLQNSNI